jgi:hypothetical protein
MKVRLLDPYRFAMKQLTQSVDPMTGERRRFGSLDALKAACRLEDVVAFGLEQEPQEIRNELRFHCPQTWHGGPDIHPSLWVNVEKQKWGCNSCGLGSDDVLGFVRKLHGLTDKEGREWLTIWASHHPAEAPARITVRLPKRGRR